jgi:hypothetical protein
MGGEHDGRARDAAALTLVCCVRCALVHPCLVRHVRTPFQGDRAEGLEGQGAAGEHPWSRAVPRT